MSLQGTDPGKVIFFKALYYRSERSGIRIAKEGKREDKKAGKQNRFHQKQVDKKIDNPGNRLLKKEAIKKGLRR
jgi:hypothetical protein